MPKTILNATIRSAVKDGGFPASSISRFVRPYRSRGVRRVIDEITLPANGKMSRSRADALELLVPEVRDAVRHVPDLRLQHRHISASRC